MPETNLGPKKGKTIGTAKEIVDVITKAFPGSEREQPLMIAVKNSDGHFADAYLLTLLEDAPQDSDSVDIGWINVVGDPDQLLFDCLMEAFKLKEIDL